jgi:flagellar protein FlaF
MQRAAQVYGNVSKQTSAPRELEANLLLKAAAQFQAITEKWDDGKAELNDALLFNRKLWTIFLTSVTSEENSLPIEVRQNVANLGLFVLNQTLAMTGDPQPERLGSLININRQIAAGLLGRAA